MELAPKVSSSTSVVLDGHADGTPQLVTRQTGNVWQRMSPARRKGVVVAVALLVVAIVAIAVGVSVSKNNSSSSSSSNSNSTGTVGSGTGSTAVSDPFAAYSKVDMRTQRGSNTREGYFPNANLDPAVVGSSKFGKVFQVAFPGGDVFATPLVYTLANGTQILVIADGSNNVYLASAETGEIMTSTNLGTPADVTSDYVGEYRGVSIVFVTCGDELGIRGTPVIDPSTSTLYLYVKTYADGTTSGWANERYMFHALSLPDLTSLPGYPVDLEGLTAQNSPAEFSIHFEAGKHMQRPALTQLVPGGPIYTGFGSHCDSNFNYTGWVIGIDAKTAAVTTALVTAVALPDWNPPADDDYGPGAPIWMSGGGFATDSTTRFFFTTGNSDPALTPPASISSSFTLGVNQSLADSAVHFDVANNRFADFFSPDNHVELDVDDLDLCSGGITVLSSYFSQSYGHSICVAGGKDTELWFMDCDNMGGYSSTVNSVLQQYDVPTESSAGSSGSTWTQVASYPAEGGYVYHMLNGDKVRVYKFSGSSTPQFSLAGTTPNATSFGGGSPLVTSLNGTAGSGILWVTDTYPGDGDTGTPAGLLAYSAIPDSTGNLQLLFKDADARTTKFTQAAIGNGKVYVVGGGYITGYGAL
ncbi:hypothetical protein HDU83_000387 [Entophlyctis luteolus]|nr:hypothetical protein HDU83_000387 [Entophlyctis luteolus]